MYSASRVRPDALAISLIPRARAMFSKCCREKSRIVRIKNVGEVRGDRLFVVEARRSVELR